MKQDLATSHFLHSRSLKKRRSKLGILDMDLVSNQLLKQNFDWSYRWQIHRLTKPSQLPQNTIYMKYVARKKGLKGR